MRHTCGDEEKAVGYLGGGVCPGEGPLLKVCIQSLISVRRGEPRTTTLSLVRRR